LAEAHESPKAYESIRRNEVVEIKAEDYFLGMHRA